nr:MAG TPA: amidohydrolase family protein [Caudoviricetes sp.]
MSLSGDDNEKASRNTAGCFLMPGFMKTNAFEGVRL